MIRFTLWRRAEEGRYTPVEMLSCELVDDFGLVFSRSCSCPYRQAEGESKREREGPGLPRAGGRRSARTSIRTSRVVPTYVVYMQTGDNN
jgi:hypothetical protein